MGIRRNKGRRKIINTTTVVVRRQRYLEYLLSSTVNIGKHRELDPAAVALAKPT
jgi:hypothetical protein